MIVEATIFAVSSPLSGNASEIFSVDDFVGNYTHGLYLTVSIRKLGIVFVKGLQGCSLHTLWLGLRLEVQSRRRPPGR